jgi:serine/threonine-protein kinase
MPTGLATPSPAAPARRAPPSTSAIGRLASSDSIETGGFAPGVVLVERYRIIGLLGRGGMGEVYRADDLKLGQPVALKFLPKGLGQDPARMERFYAEVRIARQVSHPNVCRVYDIGELEGQHYLSMEYVDGEDLASLQKRIGRLPNDKALEIARQLCAGLAAAHDKGVVHRDLKPANVMLDGRGRARITDFGLAVAVHEVTEGELSGTPAYMAPEQLEGKGASVQSDIYALGLVLYELYTGRKAFEATTLSELKRKRQEETPVALSELTRDVDPIVDRVILRCLEKDPRARPASALAVAAALPGGDPLAAALAAGETPSPEMVAAAGEAEGLKPAVAWSLLGAVLAGTLAIVLLREQTKAKLFHRVAFEKPSAVLVERAKQILTISGYTEPPADSAYGFETDTEYLRHVQEKDKSKKRWDNLDRNAVGFWYRQSPRALAPLTHWSAQVNAMDPPPLVSGMARVWLDPKGRLDSLMVVPPQVEAPAPASRAPDWGALFSEAGLEISKWTPAEPRWTPLHYADTRAAWTGAFPEAPQVPIRVEAAAYRGKPVHFSFVGPWTRPSRMQPFKPTAGQQVTNYIFLALLAGLAAGAVLLGRRNLRMGRGDRRGAFRLSLFVFCISAVAWLFGASHVSDFTLELFLFFVFASRAFFLAGLVWGLYIALEPYVRRRWPATIVSWSRLLGGSLKDPLVARDILIGFCAHIAAELLDLLRRQLTVWLQSPPPRPGLFSTNSLSGARAMISELLNHITGGIFFGLIFLFLLFLFRIVLRRQWAAGALFILVLAASAALNTENTALGAIFGALSGAIFLFVMVRFGLVAMIAAFLFNELMFFPITTDSSAWYAGLGFTALGLTAAIAFYAFFVSLGGRPVFGKVSLED